MAIEKTIDINVNSSEAIKDITLLNSVLEEQEQITIELLREQQKLEQQLRDTPKNSLAAQKKLTTQLNHVKDSIKDQNLSVKELKVQQKSLGKGTNDLTNDLVSNGGAMGILNNLTGGLAQQFKDSYEAISLSSKGLSGFKKAMLATGIGALVVGVGLLVANFDKIKDFLSGITAESKAASEALQKEAEALNQAIAKQAGELIAVSRAYERGALKGENLKNVVNNLNEKYEDANLELDENNQLTEDSLAFIDSQIKAIKVQAKNKSILTSIEALYSDELQAQTLVGQQNNKFMVERAKLTELLAKQEAGGINSTQANALRKQIARSQEKQKEIANEIKSLTNQRASIQNAIDRETKRLDFSEFTKPKKRSKSSGKSQAEIDKEEADKIKDIAEEAKKVEVANTLATQKAIEDIENTYFDSKIEKEQLEENAVREKYFSLIEAAKEYGQDIKVLEKARDEELKEVNKEAKKIRDSKVQSDIDLLIQGKKFNAEQIKNEVDKLNKLKEIDLLIQEQEALKLQNVIDNADKGTQAEIDALIALDDFKEKSRQTNITRKAEITKAEIALEAKKTAAKQKAVDDAISLAGAESKIGKALLILKQGLALKEMIMEAKKTLAFSSIAVAKSTVAVAEGTAQTAKVGFPQNIPLLIGYAAQAAGIISAISSATGKAKSAASSFGGGGGSISTPSAPPAPPSFNVVGASGSSQLADAIGGQSQQPIQTYVVANDVTTAQSLQNNIVEGATIG